MDDSTLGRAKRLKEARERRGYDTATAAAEALRVPEGTYYGHENGSRGFTAQARRYARFFKVRYLWLMLGDGEMDEDPLKESYDTLDPEQKRTFNRFLEFLKTNDKTEI